MATAYRGLTDYFRHCPAGHGEIRLDPTRYRQRTRHADPCGWGTLSRLICLTRLIGDGICLAKTDSFLHRDVQFNICFQQLGFGPQVAFLASLKNADGAGSFRLLLGSLPFFLTTS